MLKTIIIDDESGGRQMMRRLLEKYCSNVQVVALADSAEAGKKMIEEHHPDLVFLDIEMPHRSGFEMLEEMKNRDFNIVFVSAHEKYAMKAIKYSALDYLMKPVNIKELQAAIEKAGKSFQSKGISS